MSALLHLTVLSSLQMPCPSCRPFSQIGTLTTTTYLLLFPPSAEAMQSPCSGFLPTALCLAMRLLSLWQRKTTKEKADRSTSYPEVKNVLKAKQHSKQRLQHPRYNKTDPYYFLTRREQVTVFRLRTLHNCLSYHLYSKLRIGHTEQCPCGTGSQTTEHLLQFFPLYQQLRKESSQSTLPQPASSTIAWRNYDALPPS